jgi:hypothetical protein
MTESLSDLLFEQACRGYLIPSGSPGKFGELLLLGFMRFHLDTSGGVLNVFPIESTTAKPQDTIPLADASLMPTPQTSKSLRKLLNIFIKDFYSTWRPGRAWETLRSM